MNKDFLNNLVNDPNVSRISLSNFALSVSLSFLLSYILSRVYSRKSNTFSNPETLSKVLPILSIGTTIIIAVVKSSLALSLGLVGALSIVRFRTPIKEPEELTYIFLSIGIGLATGADQYSVAIIGFILTIICIYLNQRLSLRKVSQNNISISISNINSKDINSIIELLSKNSSAVNFHNFSTSKNKDFRNTNITLSFTPESFEKINTITNEISDAFPEASINIIDRNVF
ncbi:DUF4956 domain-containing protein [Prochlorococcus sp. AH-736-L23]|nr:DUF4956 domain-containing protein [Prochlorococcus sp. AH-736-L23]